MFQKDSMLISSHEEQHLSVILVIDCYDKDDINFPLTLVGWEDTDLSKHEEVDLN